MNHLPADEAPPTPVRSHTSWEYGIEYRRAYNDFKLTIEWRGYTGHDGYRVDYTEKTVRGLASGKPIYRRQRTTFEPVVGPPELVS